MKQLLYIDLFCGAGGTSTGVNTARLHGEQCATVIACVNHDASAIASHAANHPQALHFPEDIRTLELSPLVTHLEKCRRENPEALTALWASLECTNFSKAKGGQPRDADSRTLAEHLFRYIEVLNPDYIQIENVEEFMSWGSLDENGRPLSKDRGRSYVRGSKRSVPIISRLPLPRLHHEREKERWRISYSSISFGGPCFLSKRFCLLSSRLMLSGVGRFSGIVPPMSLIALRTFAPTSL